MKKLILLTLIIQFFILLTISFAQDCADSINIYSFVYDGKKYEIVKENKTWIDAANCAVERGGILAEIDSQEEQDSLYLHLQNADINNSNTVAPDGGGASYVWLGGNDIATEGEWIWDGDNDGVGKQFWQGTNTGSQIKELYNNWGNEPDDWNNQDGLGLAITDWALGSAGQWNDVDASNTLFYIIEYTDRLEMTRFIDVPGDYSTIQAAINASVDGDTVLVADGTYYENINYRGKAITVASWFLIDGDKTHIDSTIINGSQPITPDSGTVVSFISGEDTTSVLYGFTITGDTGSFNATLNIWGAGGVVVLFSGGKIIYNKIINNSVGHDKSYGGGIIVSSPLNNVLISQNIIAENIVYSTLGRGGGIFCIETTSSDRIYIINNIIMNNSSYTINGAGGISINGCNPTIKNNLIMGNYGKYGGGVQYKTFAFANLRVDELGMPKSNFVNNTVINNISDQYAGIHSYTQFIGNTEYDSLHPTIWNSIIWGNISNDNSQIHYDFIVNYSNIEGGYAGIGNIDLEPLFADTIDFYLDPLSPCVDAGNPNSLFNDIEDSNNPGFPLFPALGGLRNDMGAYGGNPSMIDSTISTVIENDNDGLAQIFELSQNYPNPFNPSTTIKYSIPKWSNVALKVFDVLGSEVATLVNKEQSVGNYEVEFDGSDLTSGIYFYRLQVYAPGRAGDFIETKKMLLMK